MKPQISRQRKRGFTFWDLIVGLVVALVLVALVVVSQARAKVRSRVNCSQNLGQLGLGLRVWANDHLNRFPWNVSTSESGSKEFAVTTHVFRHYQCLSNELPYPKQLCCPTDRGRSWVFDWTNLLNTNLSYFLGLNTDEGRPQAILGGDRTISTNGRVVAGFLLLDTNGVVKLAPALHTNYINILMADGSVCQATASSLQSQLSRGTSPVRLVIP